MEVKVLCYKKPSTALKTASNYLYQFSRYLQLKLYMFQHMRVCLSCLTDIYEASYEVMVALYFLFFK